MPTVPEKSGVWPKPCRREKMRIFSMTGGKKSMIYYR